MDTCRVLTFANGGKCGSTTLAILLKHQYPSYTHHDPSSPFVNAPKEICASSHLALTRCRNGSRFVLDACPRLVTPSRAAATLRADPSPTILVFARPQEEALLSMYNDRGSSMHAPGDGAAAWVRRNVGMPLFNYTHAYVQASAMAERGGRVVNVQTHELRTDEGVAAVLARISRAAGLPPYTRSRHITSNAAAQQDGRHSAARIDEATRAYVRSYWRRTNHDLCTRTGMLCEPPSDRKVEL